MTFDEWNVRETRRLCRGEDAATARLTRAARRGGMARFVLWDDYLAAAKRERFDPELLVSSSRDN